MLLPWVVPTVLSALAFWWIYDAQFSILSWSLMKLGLIDHPINFLGDPLNAQAVGYRGQCLARHSVRGDLAAGRTADDPRFSAGSSLARWRDTMEAFPLMTLPMLTPIIAVVMTFSVLFTFTDFQLIYVLTKGGPVNATHLMATLSFQRGIPGGQLGEGAAIAVAMIPFLLAAILFSFFGLQRRKWQQGGKD